MIYKKNNKGAVAIIAVMVVGAVTLGLAFTVGLLSITDIMVAFQRRLDNKASGAADACLEESIYRLKRDTTFTGTSITIDSDSSCTVSLTGSGSTRTVTSVGSYGNETVNLTGTLTIFSTTSGDGQWVEISDLTRG